MNIFKILIGIVLVMLNLSIGGSSETVIFENNNIRLTESDSQEYPRSYVLALGNLKSGATATIEKKTDDEVNSASASLESGPSITVFRRENSNDVAIQVLIKDKETKDTLSLIDLDGNGIWDIKRIAGNKVAWIWFDGHWVEVMKTKLLDSPLPLAIGKNMKYKFTGQWTKD